MRKQCARIRGGIGGGAVGRSGRGWTCGSVGAHCVRSGAELAVLSGRFALGVRSLFVRPCRYCVFVCHVGTRSWSARRCGSCCRVWASVYAGACGSVGALCRRFTPAVCASLPVLCVRLPCRDAGLVCAAMRFLLSRLGFGLSLSLRFCRGVLRSVLACCLRFCRGGLPRFTPAVCASLSALCVRLPCRDAELVCSAMRFCCRVLSSVHACVCGSVGALCLGSRLSFFLCQEKRDGLRYLAFLFRRSRSPFVRSRGALRLSAFVGSLRAWPFICGDLDGVTGDAGLRGNGAGGAALVRFCAATLAL